MDTAHKASPTCVALHTVSDAPMHAMRCLCMVQRLAYMQCTLPTQRPPKEPDACLRMASTSVFAPPEIEKLLFLRPLPMGVMSPIDEWPVNGGCKHVTEITTGHTCQEPHLAAGCQKKQCWQSALRRCAVPVLTSFCCSHLCLSSSSGLGRFVGSLLSICLQMAPQQQYHTTLYELPSPWPAAFQRAQLAGPACRSHSLAAPASFSCVCH